MLLASAVASAACVVFSNLEALTLPLMIGQVFRPLTAVVILGLLALREFVMKLAVIAMVLSLAGMVILSVNPLDLVGENS